MTTPLFPPTSPAALEPDLRAPRLTLRHAWYLLGAVAAVVVLQASVSPHLQIASAAQYVVAHSIAEIVVVTLAGYVFALGRAARHRDAPPALSAAAVCFLCVAVLDLAHLRSYPGLAPLVTPNTPQKTIIFWLAARLIAAVGILVLVRPALIAPWPRWLRPIALPVMLLLVGVIAWVGLWRPDAVPLLFNQDTGPTALKVASELFVVTLNGTALWIVASGRAATRPFHPPMLLLTVGLMLLSELCFLDFRTPRDLDIGLGHVIKVAAYFCLYSATVHAAVREPYRLLRESETALRQAQKMEAVGRLAGGVAHEFNNLLTVILGSSELARQDAPPDSALGEQLREITEASQRAAQLARQLLIFGRPQVLQRERLDAARLLDAFAELSERVITDGITVIVEHPASPLLVESDRAQLEQMLLNLTMNAREAMPRGGQLRLAVDAEVLATAEACIGGTLAPGRYVVFEVSDTGRGIPAQQVTRVFEPFFTTKAPGAGSGLGLSMVFGIARANQGGVRLRSTESAGTMVSVYLPMASQAQPHSAAG